MKRSAPATILDRIIVALEADVIAASDADFAEALADLGLKPQMKGSAAWAEILFRFPDARRNARDVDKSDDRWPGPLSSATRQTDPD